jgi:hypothetical protein
MMIDDLSEQQLEELKSATTQQVLLVDELVKMKKGESSIILFGCRHIDSTDDVFRSSTTTTTHERIINEAT